VKRYWLTPSAIILTLAAGGQLILAFCLYDAHGEIPMIRDAGWRILLVSAVFGWLPILTFRRKGGVKGRGYINTTILVDSGLYRIVRHPQYVAGILLNIALPMITQHWSVLLSGLTALTVYRSDAIEEEKSNIEKFGEEYKRYMERVPRFNFIAGIFRYLRSGKN